MRFHADKERNDERDKRMEEEGRRPWIIKTTRQFLIDVRGVGAAAG